MTAIQYSVVVPVYNSQDTLRNLRDALGKAFNECGASWEIVFVNDDSKDTSWAVLCDLAKDKNVVAIRLLNNFGQHNATMCGLKFAKGKRIITMDDDLQHPPKEIVKLIKKMDEGYDVVYGQYVVKQHGFVRDLASGLVNSLLAKITGGGYKITQFRIMDRKVVDHVVKFTHYNVMIDVLIKDVLSRRQIGHAVVEHYPRQKGVSNYSYRKLFAYAVNMVFSFTLWPLRLAVCFGMVFAFASALLGLFYFAYYFLYGIRVSGWLSLSLSITFLSGIILFVLGIVGEYVGRIFLNVSQKPQYIIREVRSQIK